MLILFSNVICALLPPCPPPSPTLSFSPSSQYIYVIISISINVQDFYYHDCWLQQSPVLWYITFPFYHKYFCFFLELNVLILMSFHMFLFTYDYISHMLCRRTIKVFSTWSGSYKMPPRTLHPAALILTGYSLSLLHTRCPGHLPSLFLGILSFSLFLLGLLNFLITLSQITWRFGEAFCPIAP